MLAVSVEKAANTLSTYQDIITYIASYTQYVYSTGIIKPDISQVCCWVCEKTLNNGMSMCGIKDNKITLIKEPGTGNDENDNENTGMQIEDNNQVDTGVEVGSLGNQDSVLLICGDCRTGLTYTLQNEAQQKLIKNPNHSSKSATDPFNVNNYIWPHIHQYGSNNTTINKYSNDCFIYRKTFGVVVTIAAEANETDIESGAANLSETLENQVFIEANPALPSDLFVRAQNTIRLFRLNGIYYDHGYEYHRIKYTEGQNQTLYDDLRLIGRFNAYKQARKALKQLKNIRATIDDKDIINTLISQYQILIELTGYRSTWQQVFFDGDDPGSFGAIVDVPPVPVAPVNDLQNDINMNLGNNNKDTFITKPEDLTDMISTFQSSQSTQFSLNLNESDFNDLVKDISSDGRSAEGLPENEFKKMSSSQEQKFYKLVDEDSLLNKKRVSEYVQEYAIFKKLKTK